MEEFCPMCHSGLLHSLATVAPSGASLEQFSDSSQGFVDGFPEALSGASGQGQQEEHVISQVGSLLDKTCEHQEATDASSSLSVRVGVQKPCAILPRYLADSLRQASLRSCKFTSSSGDSGISSTSTASNLSYHETLALRVQQHFTRILPRIVSVYIFSFLDPRSLCRAAQVSWYWKILCESNSIWASKCLLLGWQLPNVLTQPEPGAYKQLYIENILNLRLDGSARIKLELKKIRRRLALDEQRAVESKQKQSEGQKTSCERSQIHLNPQHHQTSGEPRSTQGIQRFSAAPKSSGGLPLKKLSNESRMSYKSPFVRTTMRKTNNKMKIAAVTERLSAPLERQRNLITYQPPILNIVRNVGRLYQQKSTKLRTTTPTTLTNVPNGQGIVPLSPKTIKALPPPPPYKLENAKEKPNEIRKAAPRTL
ncbi:hypothetical protein TcWFU_000723 [Taenia crassiceps]|uniref:F-box domain-containing protein n=1 Tax=Taenia crassiceps TaxID=6207 RepID=A0ABR4QFJ6_9CEST